MPPSSAPYYPYQGIKYFPGLAALRFSAAFLVVMHHAERVRQKNGLPNLKQYALFNHGSLAVHFFFVLSGFLITYLLLKEHKDKGHINIGAFYGRRVLRIWPLYYLLVFIGLVLLPLAVQQLHIKYSLAFSSADVWPWYIFFMPFVVNLLYGPSFLDPLWSIGVEELFYLFWAPLVAATIRFLPAVLASIVVIKTGILLLLEPTSLSFSIARTLAFEAMAIGGIGAWLVFYTQKDIATHWLFSWPIRIAIFTWLGIRVFFHGSVTELSPTYRGFYEYHILSQPIVAALFCWGIILVAFHPGWLERRWLRFLGDISYGIYMYHVLVITALLTILKGFADDSGIFSKASYWFLSNVLITAGVLGVAALSKRFFEDRFLKYKRI